MAQRRTRDTMRYDITVKHILYKNKLYGTSDKQAFTIIPFNQISQHDVVSTNHKEGIIHIHTEFPLLDTMNASNWRYEIYISPKDDSLSKMQFQINGLFKNKHHYILDTLVFHCGSSLLYFPTHKDLPHHQHMVKIPQRLSMYHSEKQKQHVIDSIQKMIHQELSSDKKLARLNADSRMKFSVVRSMCTDSVVHSYQYKVNRKETMVYKFNEHGHLRLSGIIKPDYYWWFMRSNKCKYLKCHGCCEHKFYILHRFTTQTYVDTLTLYYENGKKYKQVFGFNKMNSQGKQTYAKNISNAWDTLGKQTLKNGNGYYTEYQDYGYHYNYTIKSYRNYKLHGTSQAFSGKKLRAQTEYENGIPVHAVFYNEGGMKIRETEYDPKTETLIVRNFTLREGKTLTGEQRYEWSRNRLDKDSISLLFY